jgi:hypothetical protein
VHTASRRTLVTGPLSRSAGEGWGEGGGDPKTLTLTLSRKRERGQERPSLASGRGDWKGSVPLAGDGAI